MQTYEWSHLILFESYLDIPFFFSFLVSFAVIDKDRYFLILKWLRENEKIAFHFGGKKWMKGHLQL